MVGPEMDALKKKCMSAMVPEFENECISIVKKATEHYKSNASSYVKAVSSKVESELQDFLL